MMTKKEANEWLSRVAGDIANARRALKANDNALFQEYVHDASGSAAELEDVEIRGMS